MSGFLAGQPSATGRGFELLEIHTFVCCMNSAVKTKNKWMISGLLLLVLGIILFFTMVLTAPGILLIILGLGLMLSAYIRSGQNTGR